MSYEDNAKSFIQEKIKELDDKARDYAAFTFEDARKAARILYTASDQLEKLITPIG